MSRFSRADIDGTVSERVMLLCQEIEILFGHKVRSWQAHAIQALLNGCDVMVSASTGSGKSLVFQAMVCANPKAIVLVISPLLSLMDDQVTNLPNDVKGVAITSESLKQNPRLWDEVDRGTYQIVYACPEMLLDKKGHFANVTLRNRSDFMRNLVAVAVDECHLIWDWEGFRTAFRFIGNIRNSIINVPFVCLSATLTPNVAAYVHEVCHLQRGTLRFSLSVRRNNINTMVVPVDGDDIQPLSDLIPEGVRDLLQIPKTLVFHDNIDAAITIAIALRARLPPHIASVPPETVVRVFFGSLDEEMKSQALSDIISGKTRITICTDAFGLGVNVKDIIRVIQWHVDYKLTGASLFQRIGRCARNPTLLGTAIIYVKKAILQAVSMNWSEAWDDVSEPAPIFTEDDILVIPQSKNRVLHRFSLPVRPDTMDKVYIHVAHLYTEAKNVKEAHRQAKQATSGTKKAKLSAAEKLDPSVLWVISTTGCRLCTFLCLFNDPDIFTDSHRSWCCDTCAFRNGMDGTVAGSDVLLSTSISYLRTDPQSDRIVMMGQAIPVNQLGTNEPKRPPISAERSAILKKMLLRWSNLVQQELCLPPHILKSMVLPVEVIDRIVKHVGRIVTVKQLRRELHAAKFDIHSSLLHLTHIPWLLECIDTSLTRSIHLEPKKRGVSDRRSSQQQLTWAVQSISHNEIQPSGSTHEPNDLIQTITDAPEPPSATLTLAPAPEPPSVMVELAPEPPSEMVDFENEPRNAVSDSVIPNRRRISGRTMRPRGPLETITNVNESRAVKNKRIIKPSRRLRD